jgi:hypothetical protein
MALSWDITKCKEHEELWSDDNNAMTEQMIWLLMAVGIGQIKVTNWADVYARIKVLEKLDGAYINKSVKSDISNEQTLVPVYYSPLDVARRIGITTNVTDEKYSVWFKRITKVKNNVDNDLLQGTYYMALVAAKEYANISDY